MNEERMSIVWTWWEEYKEEKDEYSMNRMRRMNEERMSKVWTGWEGYEEWKDEYSMNRMRKV